MEDMGAFVSPDARPSSATNRLGDNVWESLAPGLGFGGLWG